jgi:hypothetical protein
MPLFCERVLDGDSLFFRKNFGIERFFTLVAMGSVPELTGAEKFKFSAAFWAGPSDEFGFFLHALGSGLDVFNGHKKISSNLINLS